MNAAELDVHLVDARLWRLVDDLVFAVALGWRDDNSLTLELLTIGAKDFDDERVLGVGRRLDSERRILTLHRLDETGTVGARVGRIGTGNLLRRIDLAKVRDIRHHGLLVDLGISHVAAVDDRRHAPRAIGEIDAVVVVVGAFARVERTMIRRKALRTSSKIIKNKFTFS